MDQTLLAIAVAFSAGAVFGYMVREGISRRRRARERQRFYYDNQPYGDAPLVPGWPGEDQSREGSQDGPTTQALRWSNLSVSAG